MILCVLVAECYLGRRSVGIDDRQCRVPAETQLEDCKSIGH